MSTELPESNVESPAPKQDISRRGSKTEVTVVTVAVLLLITISGRSVAQASWSYLLVLGAFAVFCVFLGRWINGRPMGIFIGDRNLMSLSRMQMVLWTILILSAFLTMCLRRIRDGSPNPLDIGLDQHLWALMGISTASLIGTPLLLGNKSQKTASEDAVKKAAGQLKENHEEIRQNSAGTLYVNKSADDASFADIFQGDEIGNTAFIDVAKVQMFFFTFISLLVYGTALYHMFKGNDYSQMPVLSNGLIVLLGISHAGYLTSKTADHTQTT